MRTTPHLEQRGRDRPGTFRMSGGPKKPCKEHPNWEALECVWCRREGTGAFTAGYRMSLLSKRQVEAQTGIKFDDHAAYKRWQRETKHRDQEPGERAYDTKLAIAEWVRGGAKPGEKPVGNSSLTLPQRPREGFGEWVERKKREGDRRVR